MIVVVFRARVRADADLEELGTLGARMYELGSAMPGFVEYKDFASEDGETLTLVTFETEAQLLAWRNHPEHQAVQARAREEFFSEYAITVSEIHRAYHFTGEEGRVETMGG